MTKIRQITSAYALQPAHRAEFLPQGLNCLSLALEIEAEWVVYSVFLWDKSQEGGLPALCSIYMCEAEAETVLSVAASSIRLGGYELSGDCTFEPLGTYLPLEGLEFQPINGPSSDTATLCRLRSEEISYVVESQGRLIAITAEKASK